MLEGELCVVFAFQRLTKCSTGSRFYLFHLERDSNGEITKMREVNSNECQPGIKSFFWSFLINSSYVHNLDGVWKPLYTMIRASERLLHSSDRYNWFMCLTGSVPLYIFATAGMRVLSANDQKSIYDAIYRGYRKSNLRFYLSRDNLRTIDGEMEAHRQRSCISFLSSLTRRSRASRHLFIIRRLLRSVPSTLAEKVHKWPISTVSTLREILWTSRMISLRSRFFPSVQRRPNSGSKTIFSAIGRHFAMRQIIAAIDFMFRIHAITWDTSGTLPFTRVCSTKELAMSKCLS